MRKRKHSNRIRPGSGMEEYAERNDLLEDLGFKNYPAYLRSKLWKAIRKDKLDKEPDCFSCAKPANQVHHGKYTLENLTGLTGDDLYSICGRCHKWIEISKSGYKRSPENATKELHRIREWFQRRPRVKQDSQARLVAIRVIRARAGARR